jgi:hypothetical protein
MVESRRARFVISPGADSGLLQMTGPCFERERITSPEENR